MFSINGIITGILASKIDNKAKKTPIKQNGLTQDVFQRTPAETTVINNNEGTPTLKLIKTPGKQEVQRINGTKIYSSQMTLQGEKETVYSKNGEKLYEIQAHNDGRKTKTIYNNSVNIIKSIIQYDKEGKVISKKVITPEQPTILTEEEEKRIPKYLYHLTSPRNYESMSDDGFIRTTSDKMLDKEGTRAVFLVDGKNCLNQWANIANGSESSYLTRLVKFCDKDRNGSVLLLRIETDKLDKSKIKFRDQDEVLCSFAMFDLPEDEQSEYFTFDKLYRELHPNKKRSTSNITDDIYLTDRTRRLSLGTPIQKLENPNFKPVEIMYTEEIPFEAVQEIKLIDSSALTTMSYYDEEAENLSKELLKEFLEQ